MGETDNSGAMLSPRRETLALATLFWANFVIGLGILTPAGIINELSEAFQVSIPRASSLIGYGALVLCILAPLFAVLTNRIERHLLLAAAMAIYAVGHLSSLLTSDFDTLLGLRIFTVTAAGILTPQAASAVPLFVRPERRAVAVTVIFTGWTTSFAVGLPLASIAAAYLGWEIVYAALGVASVLAAVAIWLAIPHGLLPYRLSVAAWKTVFSSRGVMVVVTISMLSMAGQFAVYPFIAADLKISFDASPETIAILLSLYGFSGLTGAIFSTRVIAWIGPHRAVNIFLAIVVVALIVWSFGHYSFPLLVASLALWGFGFSPAGASQQARLIVNAPQLASASVALNSALLYVGQSVGTFVGAAVLQQHPSRALGYIGAVIVSLALFLSVYGYRRWRI